MAVYTDVTVEELEKFLAGYDLGELRSYKGIAEGVENSNFLLHTTRGYFILTLYEKRVAAHDLPFFLGLMQHLHARGLTCPQPVADRKGELLGKLAKRPAAIVTFLEGIWVRRPQAWHCAAVGEALAKLHLAGIGFPDAAQEHARCRWLERALFAGGGARRWRSSQPVECDRGRTRQLRTSLATASAARRHPRRPVSRQCLLSRQRVIGADRLLFRLHRYARL